MYRLGKLLLIGVIVSLAIATAARAQEKPRPVTVKIDGIPADVREVATLGANGQKHTGTATGVAGEFTFAGDDFNSGKTVEIWEVICDDGTKIVLLDPSAALPPGCRKSKKIGEGIWAPGAHLTGTFPQAASGITFTPYASGGFNATYFGGTSGVCGTINDRYLAAH